MGDGAAVCSKRLRLGVVDLLQLCLLVCGSGCERRLRTYQQGDSVALNLGSTRDRLGKVWGVRTKQRARAGL